MGVAQRDFVHGISTLIPKVTVTPANSMSQQFFRSIFSGKHQIHNFLDLGRNSTLILPKVSIITLKNYLDRLVNFGCTEIQIEKVIFSKVSLDNSVIRPIPLESTLDTIFKPPWNKLIMHGKLVLLKSRGNSRARLNSSRLTILNNFQSLLRLIPLEFSLHNTFKPPWTHLIMHGKLILLKSRGNSSAKPNSKRLTNNFQRLFRTQSMEFTSTRPYQPPWQLVFYSRRLFLLNPRGHTRFIATFQHLQTPLQTQAYTAFYWQPDT